ncbi:MAG: phage terminase large subunit, partial [Alphaproteobacteria bacterium]|nr:phage terminase large subunit [Alphaproteobacteria bacterium]
LDKTVEPLGPPDGSMDLIWVNTFLHYDAVAVRKSRNPLWRKTVFRAILCDPDRADLWERWEEVLRNDGEDAADTFYADNEAALLAGSEVLWPSVQPLLALKKIKVRIGDGPFSSEYQNEPVDAGTQLFGKITFWVSRLPEWRFFGVCDPSLGKANKGGDPSAILVGGFDRATGVVDVVEASISRRLPTLIMEHIITFHKEYRCLRWGIESVQFQEFFRTQLVALSAQRGCPVPAMPILSSTDKGMRIESIQPHVFNGLIRLHPSQSVLLEQLRFYPQHAHDDGPDALEMLWRLVQGGASQAGAIKTFGARASGGGFRDFMGG